MKFLKMFEDFNDSSEMMDEPTNIETGIENESNIIVIPTSKVIHIQDHPYGFNQTTELIDTIEFDSNKGYRHVMQTKNPKTGALNKPKKGVYYNFIARCEDKTDSSKINHLYFSFNGKKEINKVCEFLEKYFDVYEEKEIEYFYISLLSYSMVDFKATVIYGGSNPEDLKGIYKQFWEIAKQGLKTKSNVFQRLRLDEEAIEQTKPEGYNPFTSRQIG